MEILLDTANIAAIKRFNKIINLGGVTTNPTIVKREGKIDFFPHMKEIRQIIGPKAKFHIQAVGHTADEFINDAQTIWEKIDPNVYVKIPTTEEGLTAIKVLKTAGKHVTATAVYTEFQAYFAMAAGADYIAPYYNRMRNMNIDAVAFIKNVANRIALEHSTSKILAASFHNVEEVNNAIRNGAQAVTISPSIIAKGLGLSAVSKAVDDFTSDWESVYGKESSITKLAENE